MDTYASKAFQNAVLRWYHQFGRHDLPWQKQKTPYRVWVSEIMLQQTQVVTVIDYFKRFMKSFPNVKALAAAHEDNVLHHWSGLGYYARARNLHKTAKMVCEQHHGRFPKDLEALQTLPGIGRSTAGAILSLASEIPASILDGNVKRVLTRVFGIKTWSGDTQTLKQLWELAESLTPNKDCHHYNQAMMDLGATVCTRSNPTCSLCPLKSKCYARINDLTKAIPASKPKKEKPTKEIFFLMLENSAGELLLEKRPNQGIWGGLWCFPEFTIQDEAIQFCKTDLKIKTLEAKLRQPFRHTFSHYHLEITPLHIKTHSKKSFKKFQWYGQELMNLGLAAPTTKLLQSLCL